jgi:hypothetical protein
MKKYFIEARIDYSYNCGGMIRQDSDSFAFIVEARSKVSARQLASRLTKDSLMELADDITEITGVKVTDIYETSDDARL